MATSDAEKVETELAGKHYVAAELCRRGYSKVSLSAGAHPQLTATTPTLHTQFSPKVNSVRKVKSWRFFVDEDTTKYPTICILVVVPVPPDDTYEVYIVPKDEVDKRSKKAREEWLAQHPNAGPDQPPMLGFEEISEFRDNWKALPQ